MRITDEVYEFVPRYATIELSGITFEEIEKLRNKRVTIILKNVFLESCEIYHIIPNDIDTKLEFFGGITNERNRKDDAKCRNKPYTL